ncbi:MAG: hypothetical protein PHT69_03300 [Bacteroidales bacterium]|nr:hypothetical protein [Bacteroidales bacterium]
MITHLFNRKKSTRFLLFTLIFLLFSVVSCVKDDNCKDCRIETYEDNVLVETASWIEYCDAQLAEVQGQTSTVGNRTTKMVCRY